MGLTADSISIVYEDEWLVAAAKPAGLLVHPPDAGAPRREPDLQTLLQERLGAGLTLFHRLDRETTGLVLLGKKRQVNALVSEAFARRRVRKAYLAIVAGEWRPEWNRVETRIGRGPDGRLRNFAVSGEAGAEAKKALTTFRLLQAAPGSSLVEAILKTGRTHQIRLHCLEKNRPILGDPLYGKTLAQGMALHAYRLDLEHPVTHEPLRLRLAPPPSWDGWLDDFDRAAIFAKLGLVRPGSVGQ